tara:strand:+ start:1133 stop:1279 length:147 start_codon:yes stop_codon:yes gene_type:complete
MTSYFLGGLFIGKILDKEEKVSLNVKLNIHMELQNSYRLILDTPNPLI